MPPVADGLQEGPEPAPDVPFPEIAGIDPVRAAESADQDPAFFLELLTAFNTEFAGAGRQSGRDLAAGEREQAIRRLHSIKGSAGALGAMGIMGLAAVLELALKRGESDVAEGLADLDAQLLALAAASPAVHAGSGAALVGRSGSEPECPSNSAPVAGIDRARLEVLSAALDSGDLDALVQFEVLEPALSANWGAAETAALGAAIAGLWFEEARVLVSRRLQAPDPRETPEVPGAVETIRKPERAGHTRLVLESILIVDDDRGAIRALHHALRGMGRIQFATSGAGALVLLGNYPFDVVLLDANMPEMDGFATCRAVRQDYPEVPVLFVTADSDFATEIRALETGAQDFITKPINPPVVRARVALHLQLRDMLVQLRNLSHRDPLTGLANRRALNERVAVEWRRAARHGQPLGLLMIDIDHFKRYNDHYGHSRGDQCLLRVARALDATAVRAGDLVARYGGEEFAVLLPGNDLAGVVGVARKILFAVRSLAIPHERSETAPHVTLSIGAASFLPAIRRDSGAAPARMEDQHELGLYLARELFDRADRALYVAKATGRDRVCVDGGDTPVSD
jgi:diguanylate cyclase (GGDEF)-like protein